MKITKSALKKILVSSLVGLFLFMTTPIKASAAPEMTEYPLPAGDYGLFSLTKGAENNFWYVLRGGEGVVKLTASGQVTQYPIPSSLQGATYKYFMGGALGSDGNIWFASTQRVDSDPEQYFIHKVTQQGQVSSYPYLIPDVPENVGCGRGISDIASGPDGNIWLLGGDDAIGCQGLISKVDTNGNLIDFYYADTINNILQGIQGPDGNIWFVAPGSVGKITPSGAITLYTIPSTAISITLGTDGNLWYSSISPGPNSTTLGFISKITPSGVITDYSIGEDFAYSITFGPDNSVWYSSLNNALGRMTLQGSYERYTLPSPGTASLGIVKGADNNLWAISWDPSNDSYTMIKAITNSVDPDPPEPEIPVVTPPLLNIAQPPKSGNLALIVLISSVLIGALAILFITISKKSSKEAKQSLK